MRAAMEIHITGAFTKEEEAVAKTMEKTFASFMDPHLKNILFNNYVSLAWRRMHPLPDEVLCIQCEENSWKAGKYVGCKGCSETMREPVPFSEVWGMEETT